MIVFKCIEIPDKEFSTKTEMFRALKENAEAIIELKKADVRPSDSIAAETMAAKKLNLQEGFVYPVINTTKYMDSHYDVHADGIWDASVKQQNGKIYYVADHKLEVTNVISFPKDVEVFVQEVAWKDLGVSFSGKTQALMFKIARTAIRLDQAKDIINERIPIEHSVRMQYVQVTLAIDSDDPDFKKEKSNWDKYFPFIVNKEKAEDIGYFWWISEAKIHKEGSMVIAGSNDVTPMVYPKNNDPAAASQKNHPSKDSGNEERKSNNYLLNY